jgi:CHRD domain
MHIFMFRCGIASLMLAAFLAVGSRALAETVSFRADLKGASEVPPTDSKGIGTVSVKYDPATRMMSWMVNYSGLTGNATGAYFHGPASITQNAEVAVPVYGNLTRPIEGSATLNATEAADLMSGNWYFNIYSADHRGGEMRGQVLKGM